MLKATEQVCKAGLGIPIGMLVLHDISLKGARKSVRDRERRMLASISGRWEAIQEHLDGYAMFFRAWEYSCPLPGQVQAIIEKGLPQAPALIQALLLCEATQGVLMGVQDWDLVQGTLEWDLAGPEEQLEGFKGLIPCKVGEPVLRDSAGLLASYFQGPDRRTAIHGDTRSVVFLAFGTPGMPSSRLEAALEAARGALEGAFRTLEGPAILEGGHEASR